MRTLTVIAELGSGGAETVVADLTRHRLDRGDEVTLASDGGWRAGELEAAGARLVPVPLRPPGPLPLARAAARLRAEVGRRPVRLVHAHNVRATLAGRLGTGLSGRRPPVLSTVHGLADGDYARAARLLARAADLVVAVSDDVAGRLVSAGLRADRLRVVENAVPVPTAHDREEARAELGLAADRPVVLCLARLAAPKRHDLLLEAWADVRQDAVLLVAGDGPRRAELERTVVAAGLEGRVRLLGDRRDVGRLLAAADLLVLPSDREGLPMAVLEAMAADVPVVASAVGALVGPDFRDALVTVPPRSAAALAAAVDRLLSDPGAGRLLAEAARGLVARRYTSDAMRSAYESLEAELICRAAT